MLCDGLNLPRLGLQHLISQHGVGSMPIMSEGEFYRRKVQYKLMSVAHQNGFWSSCLRTFRPLNLIHFSSDCREPGAPQKVLFLRTISGLVLSRFLLMKVKEVSGRPGKAAPAGGLGAGALVSGGPLAQPMQVFSPKKEKKKRDKDGC